MIRSFSTEAIVLKRVNTGEQDRVLTLLTPGQGKLACIAKGVRKLSSSQGAFLEPGNHVTVLLINTSSLPILTQTKLLSDFTHAKKDLKGIKKLMEVLEVIDQLFPEGAEEPELFEQMVGVIEMLNQPNCSYSHIQNELTDVLMKLGYQDFRDTAHNSILDQVAAVADRPMRSYDYLTVKS